MALLRTNTGIGTTNPTSALHVIGDVLVTGVVTAIGFNGNINAGIGTITNLNVTREVVGTSTITDLINTRLTSGLGTITTLNSSTATINNITNNLLSSGVGTITNLTSTNSTITRIDSTHINAGIVTANRFSTGAIGSAINITSDSITGPSSIIIDPAAVGDDTGAVRIKGNLYVDGDQFSVNSGTIELADLRVGIATTVGSNLLLDGGGIGIGSANILKTFTYNYSSDSLKSSENLDIASGKTYKINGTDVLSNNTLGNGVIYSSLQYLGTLNNLNVSGLSTLPTLVGTYATITEIDNTRFLSGIASITSLYASNGYINVGIITDLTNTRLTSGIATITNLDVTREVVGTSTVTNLYVSNGYINVGVVTDLTNTRLTSGIASVTNLYASNGYINVGVVTDLTNTRFVSGISTITNLYASNGYINVGVITDLTNTRLTSGIATITNLDVTREVVGISTITNLYASNGYINVGVVTDLTNTRLTSGIGTITDLTNTRLTSGIASVTNLYASNGYINVGVVTDLTNTRLTSGIATITDLTNTRLTSGIASVTNLYASNGYINVGVVTDLTNTRLTSGIATITNLDVTREVVGTSTVTNLYVSNGYINVGVVTDLTNTRFTSGIATITTLNSTNITSTNSDFTNLNADNAFIDVGIVTDISGTRLNYTGVGTIATLDTTNGTIDYLTNTNLTVSGIATIQSLNVQSNFDVYDSTATFHNNVFIAGNLSIGGTASVIVTQDLNVFDKEITLGITTNAFNQDVSNDVTANHGGISIASTVGYPLVDLALTGFSSLPRTYKQLMWVASNSYGVGTTDAWMFNYAVGIGSTLVPNNVRLAVGNVQITDNQIDASTGEFTRLISGIATFTGANISNIHSNNLFAQSGIVTNISGTNLNYTGVSTITNLYSSNSYINVGVITDLTNTRLTSGIATITTLNATNGNIVTGIITTLSGTNINYTGIATLGITTISQLFVTGLSTFVGVTTYQSTVFGTQLSVSGVSTLSTLHAPKLTYNGTDFGASGYIAKADGSGGWTWASVPGIFSVNNILNGFNVSDEGVIVGTAGSITQLDFRGNNIVATADPQPNGIATIRVSDTPSFVSLNVSGLSTFAGITTVTGDALFTKQLSVSGLSTFIGVGTFQNDLYVGGNLFVQNDLVFDEATLRNINVTGLSTLGIASATTLYVSGIGTFQSSGLKIRNPADTFEYAITGDAITGNRTLNLPLITGTDTLASLGLAQTFSANQTFSAILTGNGTLNLTGNTTGTHLFGSSQTSGTLTFGGTSGTGLITFGRSTASQQTDIQAGATASGNSKTINLGTGGLSGSFTQINIGSTSGVGTVLINAGTNLGIGLAAPTSKLDVVGDGRFTGVVTATTFNGQVNAGVGTITTLNSSTGTITNLSGTNLYYTGVSTITTLNVVTVTNTNINATGIITAPQFSTGATGSAVNITSDTISGPAIIYIDPAAVGDNTGAVRIKGDLYVDGTQTVINSQTIDLADFRIGIGTTATNDIVLDGAGIGIGSASNQKTFVWNNASSSLKSSENLDLASGKTYKINGTDVLSSTTLGSGVVNSSLTSVGTLTNLNVSGISTLASSGGITTTGGDLYVGNNLYVKNDLFFDEFTSRNINVTGISTLGIASATTLNVTGLSTFRGDVNLRDDINLYFGDSNDLRIYHDSATNRSYIKESGTGALLIQGSDLYLTDDDGTNMLYAANNAGVSLYNSGDEKLRTTGYGVTIFGTLESQQLNVTGVSTFVGFTTFRNNVSIGNSLDVNGNINFNGSLFQNGSRFTSGIGIGSTSVNPQSGVINQRIGIGFTDLNIVGTGISITGYGSTVVIDFGNIAAGSGALSISTVFNPRIQDITFVGGATTSRIGISTQTNRFVYDTQTGSVGIGTSGTSIPAYKLDVVGDINSSTALKVGGVNIFDEALRLSIAFG